MKRTFLVLYSLIICFHIHAQSLKQLESKKVDLPNGWSLTPAGRSFALGDLPLNIAVSSSKKYLAVTNNGVGAQFVQLIDAKNEIVLDNKLIPRSWLGLKFSADEKYLYVAAGTFNMINKYAIKNNKLSLVDSIILGPKWPARIWPAGMEIDDVHHLLYVVTKDNNSLYTVDLLKNKVIRKDSLEGEAYTCLLSPDKAQLYISCWGCDKVIKYNTRLRKISGEIQVGDNPNDICQTKSGKYLFVANSNDNTVSVIDIAKNKVIETLNCSLYPGSLTGSTTNGVALTEDEKTLYIANADNNNLAVFDVSKPGNSKSLGYIPTGWYPTAVKVVGKKVFVANGKGFTSYANPRGPSPVRPRETVAYQQADTAKNNDMQYIGTLLKGTMSVIDIPSVQTMDVYTKAVYRNTPYTKQKEITALGANENPIPTKAGGNSAIKHVFYFIKENRTYDQVLGDMKEGNGDASLCLFPERVTPNHHAIAREFVLLDNFYVDAEVSADGHNWSTAAYATDYVEKTWVASYGGRGGHYDFEGTSKLGWPQKGYIWDHLNRAGVSFRTYGEFADDGKPNIPVLKNHTCSAYGGFDLSVKDTVRFGIWKHDFDSLMAIHAVPQFNSIRLGCDHTEGLRKGRPSPFAHLADNDLALGMFIEYLSKSSIWNESAVFVLEDDAQNGPDHVDAHRSIAFVAGGLVKHHFVDHTMYSTSSMLRTMELIVGIPPMTQYDAAAQPLWRCFNNKVDLTPFIARPAEVDLNEKNTARNKLSIMSEAFDFTKEDRAPDLELNEVLWKGIKGINSVMPSPKRGAFLKVIPGKDKDD